MVHRYLGRPSTKRYIWDMIWEVDEKLNGFIDYEDFKLCFQVLHDNRMKQSH
jgi:Ca2+-binding EF-hand superfamily protein